MKLTVKTLKGSHFEIRVQPSNTIMAVKKNIEDVQGKDNYPCGQQLLIHNGKVLKDETTLADNKISEEGFLVVMLSESKSSGLGGASSVQPSSTTALPSNSTSTPDASSQQQASKTSTSSSGPTTSPATVAAPANSETYDQAASNLVNNNSIEQTIQHIMDLGGGSWDKETVTRALRAAYNNPERAIDYLYSGIPDTVEVAVPVTQHPATQSVTASAAPLSGGPNASPLNLFPQEIPSGAGGGNLGSLDFLRNNQQVLVITDMLKAPDHQVAGHEAGLGKLGPLIDDLGRFYKPLQSDKRGSEEVAFYESFSSNTNIPEHIRKFFPIYYGTKIMKASTGSDHPHIVLQDLTSVRLNPSVMDIKIGSRTWGPEASEAYIAKCLKKDRETTSTQLGFRISGLQVYIDDESGFYKPDRNYMRKTGPNDVRLLLRNYVSSNPSSGTETGHGPNCSSASSVYGGSNGILTQLLELKTWFESQTIYHFNACSLLFMFDNGSNAEVKLIDFAHVTDGNGVIDHNFLGGLCSLIKFISDILAETNKNDYTGANGQVEL